MIDWIEENIIELFPRWFRKMYYTRIWGKNITDDFRELKNENRMWRRLYTMTDEEFYKHSTELKRLLKQRNE